MAVVETFLFFFFFFSFFFGKLEFSNDFRLFRLQANPPASGTTWTWDPSSDGGGEGFSSFFTFFFYFIFFFWENL